MSLHSLPLQSNTYLVGFSLEEVSGVQALSANIESRSGIVEGRWVLTLVSGVSSRMAVNLSTFDVNTLAIHQTSQAIDAR